MVSNSNQNGFEDGLEALGRLRGTAVERILIIVVREDGSTLIVRYVTFPSAAGLEPMTMDLSGCHMHVLHRPFSPVPTRAFLVDAYHGVPIANAFGSS